MGSLLCHRVTFAELPKEIFDDSKERLQLPPSDAYLLENVHVHNAYIAGYLGYIELGKLAYPDGNWDNSSEQQELDRLLNLRAIGFSKDSPYTGTVTPLPSATTGLSPTPPN